MGSVCTPASLSAGSVSLVSAVIIVQLGPCRIDPYGGKPSHGVCGANVDTIVARNLLDDLAVGAAAHSDHGREVVEVLLETAEGKSEGYRITDEGETEAGCRRVRGFRCRKKTRGDSKRSRAWSFSRVRECQELYPDGRTCTGQDKGDLERVRDHSTGN